MCKSIELWLQILFGGVGKERGIKDEHYKWKVPTNGMGKRVVMREGRTPPHPFLSITLLDKYFKVTVFPQPRIFAARNQESTQYVDAIRLVAKYLVA
jgi:hypothetical protein